MKKIFISLLALISFLVLTPAQPTSAAASQDFYFRDFTADYYLNRQDDGTSKLHVKEVMTAVFPETDQNHGITRIIPATNQDGANRTIKSRADLNLTVLRNGVPEPVSKLDYYSDHFTAYIGDADTYVHGAQTYILEYDFTDVITEFDQYGYNASGQDNVVKAFQELYWDTNGNGWEQSFDKLTANLHFDSDIASSVIPSKTSCYVGAYGAEGSERCTITPTSDGFSFTTYNLDSGENLTFAVDFHPNTFNVVIETSYILVVALIIVIAFCSWAIIAKVRAWNKSARPLRKLYKELFDTPQYLPPEDENIHVAEGGYLYMKKSKPSYVATLLELAVSKAITITKVSDATLLKKATWSVHVDADPSTFSQPQLLMLKILANSAEINQGDDITIKKHTMTTTLASYARQYNEHPKAVLETKGYLDPDATKIRRGNTPLLVFIILFWGLGMLSMIASELFESTFEHIEYSLIYAQPVGAEVLPSLIFIIILATIVIYTVLGAQILKYSKYTEKGIRMVKYLEGLELYIKMAEADRLSFLQSAKGADTSEKGIVKLYEKLLPWACLFGHEKSWMEELQKYYEVADVSSTIDSNVVDGIVTASIVRDISSVVQSSTGYYNSSSGGSSSSSSGGGGGGSSGGGGGGGGGGGW